MKWMHSILKHFLLKCNIYQIYWQEILLTSVTSYQFSSVIVIQRLISSITKDSQVYFFKSMWKSSRFCITCIRCWVFIRCVSIQVNGRNSNFIIIALQVCTDSLWITIFSTYITILAIDWSINDAIGTPVLISEISSWCQHSSQLSKNLDFFQYITFMTWSMSQ